MARTQDLVVVGAGSAGLTAARLAAGLGASVTLVERARPGGDCLWTGCVPSKALLAAAAAAHAVRTAGRFGVRTSEPEVDFPAVLAHVRAAQAAIEPEDSAEALRRAGVEVVAGAARFTAPSRVEVDGRVLRFRSALVATGSTPVLPPVPGLAGLRVLTSETVWDLDALPERLVVLGGGTIGCELGQGFARLGARVVVVERGNRLLPREEPEASAVVRRALEADGVDVRTERTAVRADGGALVVRDPSGVEVALECDAVLVAAGRRARTDGLDLDAAGVAVDDDGHVRVDDRLRTTNPRVFAAGDVTGAPPFTHVAGLHGSLAAANAVVGPLRAVPTDGIGWVTFTDPEVARVGRTIEEAGPGAVVRRVPGRALDRAVADGRTEGFTLLVGDRRGRLVGATVVSPRAGETIAELAGVITAGGPVSGPVGTVHPYPTYGDGVWAASVADYTARLRRPSSRAAIAVARRARRAWLARP